MTQFACVHQTPGTNLTAQAAYVATTPSLLWYNSAGKTSKIHLRKLVIQFGTTVPTNIQADVLIDTVDRYVSGGTAIVPQEMNAAGSKTYPGTGLRSSPTCSTTTTTQRVLASKRCKVSLQNEIIFEFEAGECHINSVGSIMVFVYDAAGAQAPTYQFTAKVDADE